METYISMPPIFGLFGLLIALVIYFIVVSYDEGSEKVKKIADQIHLGAMVFMRREYTYLFFFVLVLILRLQLQQERFLPLWRVGLVCFLQLKQTPEQLPLQLKKALK